MNKLLDPLQNGMINLPGAHQLTLLGLRFAGNPTDEEFDAIDRLAQSIDKLHAWADGDVAAEYVRREQHKRPGMTVATLIHEYATARSKQVDQVKARYSLCKAYRHKQRSSLSWTHHWIVWSAGIEGNLAQDWLAKAEQHGWRVEELRAQIKKELRPAVSTEPAIHGWFAPELQDAVDYVSGRLEEVDEMPIEQVGALLREAQPLVDYVDRLRARMATPTRESSTQPAGLR